MPSTPAVTTLRRRALAAEDAFHGFAQRHAVTLLRVALGFVFVLFGALKFFPGLSPAQTIAEATTEKLTLGLVPAASLLLVVAVVEVTVGLLLIANRAMRFALWLLAFEMLAILSPLVLLTGQLFAGPHHLPNLLGQYILKDFVLMASVLVLFAMQRGTITVAAPERRTAVARTPRPAPAAIRYPAGSRRYRSASSHALAVNAAPRRVASGPSSSTVPVQRRLSSSAKA